MRLSPSLPLPPQSCSYSLCRGLLYGPRSDDSARAVLQQRAVPALGVEADCSCRAVDKTRQNRPSLSAQKFPGHVTRFDQSGEMELNPIGWETQTIAPRNLSNRPRESALAASAASKKKQQPTEDDGTRSPVLKLTVFIVE